MCKTASFFHNVVNGEIAVKVLDSHGKTEKQLALDLKVWREGHYTPSGDVELRYADNDRLSEEEKQHRLDAFMHRFPSFTAFFNWAMPQCCDGKGHYIGSLDLSSLTKLDPKVKLPQSIGNTLYLSSLTELDPSVKLPQSIGGTLDLHSLTKLDPKVKLPQSIGDTLYLGSLKKLDPAVKLPQSIGGGLYLGSLTAQAKETLSKKYPKLRIY